MNTAIGNRSLNFAQEAEWEVMEFQLALEKYVREYSDLVDVRVEGHL